MSLYESAMEAVRLANLRMDAVRRALEATLLGTPEQRAEAEAERRHAAIMDLLSTFEPPPPFEPRRKLIPNWAWRKRMRGW